MNRYEHSVYLDEKKCSGCTACLKHCPTEAIRIRGGHASIDPDRCIDCGECIRVCPHNAKKAVCEKLSAMDKFKWKIALPAPSLYGQFDNLEDVDYVLDGLLKIGFDNVFEVSAAAELVSAYTRLYLKTEGVKKPAISSACPVVIRLIGLRFPSLTDNIIHMLPPMEIAAMLARKKAKREHPELTDEEICFFIKGYTDGTIPDYQASALAMAIYLNGMTERETATLTMAMAHSGDVLNLDRIEGIKVDKHSTGGVGDKTSLVLGPMVAALDVPVAKMSGRGLGHTGGTIDKLESFPGFVTGISEEQFFSNVNRIKIAIAGQTGNLAPADKKLYALRDVTATVENISLIASSIMSKKIAAGADVIVLDVKTGSGAFMKTPEKSLALAKEMVKIGCNVGKKTMAVVSNMDEPLGYAVGNALEVKEAIDTLNGEGPTDLLTLCIELGSHMIMGAGLTDDKAEAGKMLKDVVDSKKALNKLAELVEAQGGDKNAVYNKELLPKASIIREFVAKHDGYVSHIECDEVGKAAMVLGGGRENKDSIIDLSVGIVLHKKVGDFVRKGENIATFHANDENRLNASLKCFENAYVISDEVVHKDKLIQYIVTEEGVTDCG